MKLVQATFKDLLKARRRPHQREREVTSDHPLAEFGEYWHPRRSHRRHNPWRHPRRSRTLS